jgi:hypothetical protein
VNSSDNSAEWAALLLAAAASTRAGEVRSALGGYVPLGHPAHPSKWSRERQDALASAETAIAETSRALRLATKAYENRAVPD